jgi:hypothetical protein
MLTTNQTEAKENQMTRKPKHFVTAVVVLLLAYSGTIAFAQQKQPAGAAPTPAKQNAPTAHASETTSKTVAIPATVAGIFDEVTKSLATLDKLVAAKDLDNVHEQAFTVRDLLLALPDKAKGLSEEAKASLTASLARIKQQAGLLDKYGDAGDAAQVKAVLAKFKEEIEKIKKTVGLTKPA